MVPFAENVSDWQFAVKDFELKGSCTQLLVVIRCAKNPNTILLSDFELNKVKNCICANCEEPDCKCNCNSAALCYCTPCLKRNDSVKGYEFGNLGSDTSFDGIKAIQALNQFTADENYIFKETNADMTIADYDYAYDEANGGILKTVTEPVTETETDTLTETATEPNEKVTYYKYDVFGLLTEITFGTSSVGYTYTDDKLTAVSHNGFYYKLYYNEWGQISQVAVSDQLNTESDSEQIIVSFTYGTEQYHNRLTGVTYNNTAENTDGSAQEKITVTDFYYDADGNIIEIFVNGEKNFVYAYDSLGNFTEKNKVGSRTVKYTGYRTEVLNSDEEIIYSSDINDFGGVDEYIGGVSINGNSNGLNYSTTASGISGNPADGEFTDIKTVSVGEKNVKVEMVKDWFGRSIKNTVRNMNLGDDNTNEIDNNEYVGVESNYDYAEPETDKTSYQIAAHYNVIKHYQGESVESEGYNYNSYNFDDNGNITEVSDYNGNVLHEYRYDNLNQLCTEINYIDRVKYEYSYVYDSAGNITSKTVPKYSSVGTLTGTETINYIYETVEDDEDVDIVWKDKLTKYKGQQITYDAIGNPTSLMGATLSWTGKQLDSYTFTENDGNGGTRTKTIEYSYDENGLIYEKNFNLGDGSTESYKYIWSDDILVAQIYTSGESTHVIRFVYDLFGAPYGFIINDTATYMYLKNIQGDIIGVINESAEVVLTYSYDAWGSIINSTKDATDPFINIIEKLPLRYRSCFYDHDTNLYFTQNRYYSPELCRFINPGTIENIVSGKSVLSANLYSYCENNPVMYAERIKNTDYLNTIKTNYTYNKNISEHVTGYIYDQEAEPVSKLRYGLDTTARDGCGWVATYNTLMMLGNRMDPCDIIREYDINGVLHYGLFGTYPAAIVRFFKVRGYDVKVTYDASKFDDVAQNSMANIMFYTRGHGGHYIALKKYDSYCLGCNVFKSSRGVENLGESIAYFLSKNNYYGRILITISSKKQAGNPDESNENLQE